MNFCQLEVVSTATIESTSDGTVILLVLCLPIKTLQDQTNTETCLPEATGASHLDKSSVMFSSLIPPNTLNFFKLHTWVFSYFPKVMLWTIAGLSNFKIKNCGKRSRHVKQTESTEQSYDVFSACRELQEICLQLCLPSRCEGILSLSKRLQHQVSGSTTHYELHPHVTGALTSQDINDNPPMATGPIKQEMWKHLNPQRPTCSHPLWKHQYQSEMKH